MMTLKGMKFPIGVNPSGGALTIEGTATIGQNIILAVRPAGSLHPWNQKLTPEEDLIFDIKDSTTGNVLTMHIREFFRELEHRGHARLLPGRQGLSIRNKDESNTDIFVRYVNLETGETEEFSIPISGGR